MRVQIDDEVVIKAGHTQIWARDDYTVTVVVTGLTEKGEEIVATLIMSHNEIALLAQES